MPCGIVRGGLRPLAGAGACASAAAAAPVAMPTANVPVMKSRLFSIVSPSGTKALFFWRGCCAKNIALERGLFCAAEAGLPALVAEMGSVEGAGLGADLRPQLQAQG